MKTDAYYRHFIPLFGGSLLLMPLATLANQGDFCLTYTNPNTGVITHTDKPFTAGFANLCLNGACSSATLVNGVWTRQVTGLQLGVDYNIGTQIQDNDIGQCVINANVTFSDTGSCVASSCLPADTQVPSIPTNLVGTDKNGQAVALSWTASTDDRGVSRYDIMRDSSLVGSTNETSYNDQGLNQNSQYTYAVRACDGADNCSGYTNVINVSTGITLPDTTPPSVPGVPTGETITETEITVSWTSSSDADGVVANYQLYRDNSLIATLSDTQYQDTGLAIATTYRYSVSACDDSGNCSIPSNGADITTAAPDFSYLHWEFTSHNSTEPHSPGGQAMIPHNEGAVGPVAYTHGPEFLATPINGAQPTSHGFAFDINGNELEWRWGPYIFLAFPLPFDGPPDVGLEMHCSEDGIAYQKVDVNTRVNPSSGYALKANIPCSGDYNYFFRYRHPLPLNNDPASAWIYTGGFTTAGPRVDVNNYVPFIDGSANWMRYRHPVSHDGTTAAVLDNKQNSDRIRQMDRYTIWVDDKPGDVEVKFDITNDCNCLVRNDVQRNAAGDQNGQQQFSLTQYPGFDNAFSYGQVVQFEFTASGAGASSAQTYNDFSYYTIGQGFGSYGDPRLNSAGKAGTTMWFSDSGAYSASEYNAVFTQPVTTANTEQMIDDFIVGHHLFHGVDPMKPQSHVFDDPDVQIGERTCGNCHFRDGRGSEVIQTPRGPRLPPPTYGVKLLEVIDGRQAGFRWDGQVNTVAEQIRNAFLEDHKVDANILPPEVVRLVTAYTELLTVPNRNPGSYDIPGVAEGEVLFNDIGCASCHTPTQVTRADAPAHLRNLKIRPYTDMQVWNLGEGEFRTAPLWGLGHNLDLLSRNGRAALFMHDGASTSIRGAIERHNGQGTQALNGFSSLTESEKANLIKFIETL